MRKLVIDMETRSRVDLKVCGVYVYAEAESTDILCIAAKLDDRLPALWVNDSFEMAGYVRERLSMSNEHMILCDEELMALIESSDEIHAHNVQFERVLWAEIMVKRHCFHPIPFLKWRDTAAKAAAFALPRQLEGACKALDLAHQKWAEGYRVMLRMCKPNAKGKWHERPQDFFTLCEYCIRDVEAEKELDDALPDLSYSELAVWRLDQLINDRGIQVDLDGIENLIYKIQYKEARLLEELQELTAGELNSTRQRDKTLEWLNGQGVEAADLTKATVTDALAEVEDGPAKRVLEIRQSLAKASVAKFEAMLNRANADGRVRGAIMYHAAGTGRFGGKGIQPQNLPRDSYGESEIEYILDTGVEEVEKRFGNCIIQEAAKCVRGMIIAPPGEELLVADFAAIEARGLAWIAGEEHVLQDFRNGLDVYKTAASPVFSVRYEAIDKDQRFVGKTIVLACGYQGWTSAFRRAAGSEADKFSDEQLASMIQTWRQSRLATTAFWAGLEEAAMRAVETGRPYSYGKIKFGIRGRFLHCRLPSGRVLSYFDPAIETKETPYGIEKQMITYSGVELGRWVRKQTYGGKLTENVVQALCRDLLCEGMLRVEPAGYPVMFHVHDEVVSTRPEGTADIDEFVRLLVEVPRWAEGFPIKAEGWVGKRYRKE